MIPHLFERLFLISWENNRDCHITMPLSLKTMEVQIKGDQWNKRFKTVQVCWGRNLVAMGPLWKGHILGDPGAVSQVWKRGRRKFSRTGERAPGMLPSTDQFQDSSERFSVIWHKNTIWDQYLSYCFRDLLIRRVYLQSRPFAVPVYTTISYILFCTNSWFE